MRFHGLGLSAVAASFIASALLASSAFAGGTGGGGGLAADGTLILRTDTLKRWEYDSFAIPGAPNDTQSVGASTASGEKCWLTPTDGHLVVLGPNTSPSTSIPRPGYVDGSIGIFGGGNSATARGVACSRVSGSEQLALTLGAGLPGRLVSNTRLDVEVKQDALLLATAKLGGVVVGTFELQSGGSIGASPVVPGSVITVCSAASDSGPDSGPNDNCTWPFTATYDTLELRAVVGAFSLEGGGDWGSLAAQHYSEFTLVRADGVLGCAAFNNEASESAFSVDSHVTRIDLCSVAIPYVLEHRAGTPTPETLEDFEHFVDFFTDSASPLQEYNVRIVWNPIEVASIADVPQPYAYWSVPGDPTQRPLDLCLGTITEGTDADGNPAFFVTGDGQDSPYACQLSISIDQLADVPAGDPLQVQVTQLIYLRGDPTFGGR